MSCDCPFEDQFRGQRWILRSKVEVTNTNVRLCAPSRKQSFNYRAYENASITYCLDYGSTREWPDDRTYRSRTDESIGQPATWSVTVKQLSMTAPRSRAVPVTMTNGTGTETLSILWWCCVLSTSSCSMRGLRRFDTVACNKDLPLTVMSHSERRKKEKIICLEQ